MHAIVRTFMCMLVSIMSMCVLLYTFPLMQVKLMIEIELAYMNTNHPDFIGFDRYSETY